MAAIEMVRSPPAIVFILSCWFILATLLFVTTANVSCDTQSDPQVRMLDPSKENLKGPSSGQVSRDNHESETIPSSERNRAHEQRMNDDISYANTAHEDDINYNPLSASASPAIKLLRHQIKRAAGRGRQSRVQLAQRPKSTTTSTTSTTPSTTTLASNGPADGDEELPGDSGDYEELESSRSKSKVTPSSTTAASEESGGDEEQGEEQGEDQSEEQSEEQEELGVSSSTSTTTTTQRSTTARRMNKWGKKETISRGKAATSERPKSGRQKSKPKHEDEIEEGELDGDDEGEKMKPTTTATPLTQRTSNESVEQPAHYHELHQKKKPLVALPFIRQKNISVCIPEAYLEFPRDLIGDKWRARGLIVVHLFVVCYMFYSLALVCERYFMPSLEEFAQRLQISEDVAGATLMSAGSSAPELFTAILGVFVAKGDVGTGAIVGSAVFNILFVIGVCAFVSTTTAQLQWWPVLRDSVYYTFTVLVLILIIYDERVTALESASMLGLYGVYIAIMAHNEQLKETTTHFLLSYSLTAKLISSSSITIEGPDDVFGGGSLSSTGGGRQTMTNLSGVGSGRELAKTVEEDSIYLAACLVIVRHKRLFRHQLRFQSAARYIIVKCQHRAQQKSRLKSSAASKHEEVNYFGPENEPLNGVSLTASAHSKAQRAKMEAYARSSSMSKNKFSIVSKDDYEFWHRPPEEGENYYLWLLKIPVNYVLHYTTPDCTLYPDKYVLAFFISICWTALFSYIMVWMVTIIGYTLGIPDSVMGVTFLAAGTSIPDCYSSIYAARQGMADMAVSNSIGSNVFDILVGLALPWFIQSAIYPGVVATINSRGVIYSVVLLFLSLLVTIYLMNRCDWNLQPRLGLALILAYAVFIILTCMLEFNLFGHVNPPPCPAPSGGANY